MATLSKAAFLAKYEAIFADNTSGDISEQDMRDFRQDIADSLFNPGATIGSLNVTVLEIGDWDMDADISKSVTHGVDASKIRGVDTVIRHDDDLYTPLYNGGYYVADPVGTTVDLFRTAAGPFDSINYNSTSFNRGWVTIFYID